MDTWHELLKAVELPPDHRQLVCCFLLVFSRFEFALKRLGYIRQQGDLLLVDWRRFARETTGPRDIDAVVQILIMRPPARQRLSDGGLDWVFEEPPAADVVGVEWLLEMVYRVRNNLFHGGKWPPDPARDKGLLEASLAVLGECLHLRSDLRPLYFGE